VFCGEVTESSIKKVNESNCVVSKKYNDTEDCVGDKDECGGEWFTGPWSEVKSVQNFLHELQHNIKSYSDIV